MTGVDLVARTLTSCGERIPYGHLVLVLGSVPNYFGVPGAADHAFFLRWIDDAIALRHQVVSRFESAVV